MPYAVVVRFTLLQVVYLLGVWALTTWAGIAGIAFPVPIMALVPIRQFLLPRLFDRGHLSQLDAAEYEEAPAVLDKLRAAQVGWVLERTYLASFRTVIPRGMDSMRMTQARGWVPRLLHAASGAGPHGLGFLAV